MKDERIFVPYARDMVVNPISVDHDPTKVHIVKTGSGGAGVIGSAEISKSTIITGGTRSQTHLHSLAHQ